MCPVCTAAVVTSVGLSRWLGIDDIISGLWIGGLIVSLIIWTINWLNSKNIHFFGRKIVAIIFYYAMVIAPLYWAHIMGHVLNKFWGIDKLLLGIIIGSLGFSLGMWLHSYLKAKNNNRVYFPFQKVVMPILPLIILSIVFYFLTRR